jgi:regulator of protease activity HflC (stomatin/prohibitin superfamily)
MNVSVALSAIVSLVWIIVIGLLALAVIRASRGQKVKALSTTILVLSIFAVILTSVAAGLVFIQPEERGVVISAVDPQGYKEDALQPGLNWIVPFFENVVNYPISKQTYTMSMIAFEGQVQGDDSVTARTSDGQEVFIDASVIYNIDPNEVIRVHIAWQDRYPDDLVRPLSRGVIRDAVAQFKVEEVYSSKRAETARLAEQARQVARGQADAVVINAEGLAEAVVIEAKAEAEALDLIAKAVENNQDLLTYSYISKISPGIQVMLLPNDVPYLLPLPTVGPPLPESFLATPTPTPTPLPTPSPTPTP